MTVTLRVETIGDAAVLTLARPASRNALDRALARRIGEAVRFAGSDPAVRGIVLAAEGEVFSAGGDLREIDALAHEPDGLGAVLDMIRDLETLESCDVPVVAAVQGDALGGGCELLLLCDFVILERHATLAFRQARMGLSPAWGGATRLLERVGPLEASRLLLTAERIDAEEALRIGLVSEVVAQGEARGRAIARVARIADNPRTTVAAIKRSMRQARLARRGDSFRREAEIFAEVWGSGDHLAALTRFTQRPRG